MKRTTQLHLAIRICSSRRPLAAAVLLLASALSGAAQGVPEPNLVLCGQIWNPANGPNARLTSGALTWTFQPVGSGTQVVATVQMAGLNDPFSFLLQVPCETQLGIVGVSSNVLQLSSSAKTYNRANVLLNGQPLYLKYPTQALFSVTSANRGRIERVDLTTSPTDQDSNGNGLPDGWQMLHFGRLGVDPNADPDHDGMRNLAEYLAGTDPTNSASAFRFTKILPDPSGGIRLDWLSSIDRTYVLQRSFSPLTGYIDIATDLAATPPANSYLDWTATDVGPYYYRLKLQQGQLSLADLDGNRLADAWERQYFGRIHIDSNADVDGDGMSNLAEYLAGTDPTDISSNFKGLNITIIPNSGVLIAWSSVVNRTYSLHRSTNLLSGYEVIASEIVSTPPITLYHDSDAPSAKACFYRISVP